MARVRTPTLMSLEQYVDVLGLEPRHFQQVYCNDHFPVPNDMNSMWWQYAWQRNGKACREELAQAIAQAEHMITTTVGYFPAPQWVEREIHRYPFRVYQQDSSPMPRHWSRISTRPYTVHLDKRMFISGGRKITELLEAGAAVTLSDEDGDGYDETATVSTTVADNSDWLEYEIMVVAHDDDPRVEYSIRNQRVTFPNSTTVTIVGNSAQYVDPTLWESPDPIDGDTSGNYLDEVDVYRVYNSYETLTNVPVEFGFAGAFSGVALPLMGVNAGVMQTYLPDSGIVSVMPAVWNDTSDQWDYTALYNEPHLARCWYYSGWPCDWQGRVQEPFARAIASLATALVSKAEHTYGPPNNLMVHWQAVPEEVVYAQAACPWGSKNGAWEAYTSLRHLIQGDVGGTSV